MGEQLLLFGDLAEPRAPPRGGRVGRLFEDWRSAVVIPRRRADGSACWIVLGPETEAEAIRAAGGKGTAVRLAPRAWRVDGEK